MYIHTHTHTPIFFYALFPEQIKNKTLHRSNTANFCCMVSALILLKRSIYFMRLSIACRMYEVVCGWHEMNACAGKEKKISHFYDATINIFMHFILNQKLNNFLQNFPFPNFPFGSVPAPAQRLLCVHLCIVIWAAKCSKLAYLVLLLSIWWCNFYPMYDSAYI